MVIHDMRNPTSAIKMGLEQTIFKLREIGSLFDEQEQFNSMCEKVIKQMDSGEINGHQIVQ